MMYLVRLSFSFLLLVSNSLLLAAYPQGNPDVFARIDSLNDLAWQLKQTDIDQAAYYAREAARLSIQADYAKGKLFSLKNLVVVDMYLSKYDSAKIKVRQLIAITNDQSDTVEMANAYNILGGIYFYTGELEEGINYYLKALKLMEAIGDLKGTAKIYNNISSIYAGQDKYRKSIAYSLKSIVIKSQLNDSVSLASSYNNLGLAYRKMGKYDSALYYSKQGLRFISGTDDKLLKASLYASTGEIYFQQHELDSALKMYLRAVEISNQFKEKRAIVYALLGVGRVYSGMGDYQRAKAYLEEGNRLALAIGVKKEIADSYAELAKVYAALNDYREAFNNQVLFSLYRDSVNNEKKNKIVEELERKYNYEKQQNQIHQFEIENQYQEAKFIRQRIIGGILFGGLLIVGSLAYFLKRSNHAKRLAIEELRQRNKEVELKNLEIQQQQKNIKEKNRDLDAKNKKLIQLDEEKNHLMSVVAHDLRSPLNHIIGLANIIKIDDHNLNEEQKTFIDQINQSAEKLNEMILKILGQNNASLDNIEVNLMPVDIGTIIQNAITGLETRAEDKNIRIHFETDTGLPKVMADSNFAFQVFTNLISNAIKFSPLGSNVYITAAVANDNLEVHVKDEGPGISEEDQKRLFGRYQRLSARPTAGESSTGLGLSIVKQYMELMQGSVTCVCEEGKGADFIVSFSLA